MFLKFLPIMTAERLPIRVFSLLAVLGILFAYSFTVKDAYSQSTDDNEVSKSKEEDLKDMYEMLELLAKSMDIVKQKYVEPIDNKKLIEAAISGMLKSLDPHSKYLDKRNLSLMNTQTRGKFGGVGIEITIDKYGDEYGYVKIISPIDDTPAAKAGLQAGDFIIRIDGQNVLGMTINDAVDLMRGEVGEDVVLEIARPGLKPFEVTITRDIIRINPVKFRVVDGDLGYIRIASFTNETQPGLEKAIKKIAEKLEGKDAKGYIIDLRNNPGGLLGQAISVSDSFLEHGEIVSTRGRTPDDGQRFHARKGDLTKNVPLIVIINSGSASASEIVAGALQGHSRALIVGSKSFGKGSVQTIIPIDDKGVSLKLTTQRYYTPSGESIQAKGIVPDIEIVPSTVTPIKVGYQTSESDLRGALDNPDGDGNNDVNLQKDNAGDATDLADDYVLLESIKLLRGIVLYEKK